MLYIGAETVLANLLCYKEGREDGITARDVYKYCKKVREKLIQAKLDGVNFVYFDTHNDALETAIARYKVEFKKFVERFFVNEEIHINYFIGTYSPEICRILKEAATEM